MSTDRTTTVAGTTDSAVTVTAGGASIGEAVRLLAAACDGARERDDQGFNATDAPLGHRLAAIPEPAWTAAMAWHAYQLLAKYAGQLARGGITYRQLPVPDRPNSAPDRVLVGQAGTDTGRLGRGTLASPMPRRVTRDGDLLILEFPFDPAMVTVVRALPGRRWDPERKVNTVPVIAAAEVLAFADAHSLDLDPALRADLEALAARPAAPPPPNITLDADAELLVVQFPYDSATVAAVKAIPGRRWDKARPAWLVPLTRAADVLDLAAGRGLTVDDAVHTAAATAAERAEQLRAASRADAADLEIAGLGGQLLPFQRAGVAYALAARRCFIADQPGLGKTVQALAAVHAVDAFPAVVVVPASVKLNWAREAVRWLPGRSVQVLAGTRPEPVNADLTIVNYDILPAWSGQLASSTGRQVRALILDESHYVKNAATRRTKACAAVAKAVPADGLVLLLSGTPLVNRPAELIAQLKILDRLEELGGWRHFARRYCNAQHTGYGWDLSGAAHLDELNDRLRERCYVRRRKHEVLRELPAKRRVTLPLDLDPARLADYHAAEHDLCNFLADRAAELAAAAGSNPYSAATMAALRAQAAEHLVKITTLRRLAVLAKLPAIAQWVDTFVASGEKLIIFAHHRDVLDTLTAAHGGLRIAGDDPPAARQAAVDRFQTDPDARVIACSIQAAGIGLTLTAASDVLFVEHAWTPAALEQAEDRAHRIGQQQAVTAWYTVAPGTIDEDLLALVDHKRGVVDAAADGRQHEDGAAGGSVAADLLQRLAERGLADRAAPAPTERLQASASGARRPGMRHGRATAQRERDDGSPGR